MSFEIKNVTGSTIEINNLVQVNPTTPHADDGKILAGQTLNVLNSFSICGVWGSREIANLIYEGSIVFVLDGVEKTTQETQDIFCMGPFAISIAESPGALSHLKTLPEFQEAVRDALQNLTGTDRLDASAIKNLSP